MTTVACSLSLGFQYVILQAGCNNRQAYQLEGVILIQDQILLFFILEEMSGSQKGELMVGS